MRLIRTKGLLNDPLCGRYEKWIFYYYYLYNVFNYNLFVCVNWNFEKDRKVLLTQNTNCFLSNNKKNERVIAARNIRIDVPQHFQFHDKFAALNSGRRRRSI